MLLRVAQWGQAPLRPHVDAEDKEDALIQGPLGGAQTMAQWGQAPLRPRTYSDACPRDYSPRDYFRPQKLHVVIYVKVCGLF